MDLGSYKCYKADNHSFFTSLLCAIDFKFGRNDVFGLSAHTQNIVRIGPQQGPSGSPVQRLRRIEIVMCTVSVVTCVRS